MYCQYYIKLLYLMHNNAIGEYLWVLNLLIMSNVLFYQLKVAYIILESDRVQAYSSKLILYFQLQCRVYFYSGVTIVLCIGFPSLFIYKHNACNIKFKGAVCKKCISNNHKLALICH